MASVRVNDTSLWLNNKLGDSDDLWSGISSFSSQLNREVLQNIQSCFLEGQSQVKLKLLLSFLHMHRRNVDEVRVELEDIIEQALQDDDEWVRIIADILRTYPSTGRLNLDIEQNHPTVADALQELRRIVAETDPSTFLPMECQYLNRNALTQLVGLQPPPVKHFTLKRKPKSATIRTELLQKSAEAQALQRKQGHSNPLSVRARIAAKKTDDHTPLKGIPKTAPISGFRSHANLNRSTPLNRTLSTSKERGTKLLDITEQPMGGGREAKRRKKMQEIEAMQEQMKKDKEAPPATPEYAAGLVAPAVQKPGVASTTTTAPTPSYVPTTSKPASLLSNIGQSTPPSVRDARENLQQQLNQQLQQSQLRQQTTVITTQITQPQPAQQQQQQQPPTQPAQPQQTQLTITQQPPQTTVSATTTAAVTTATTTPAASTSAQPAAKKGLSLTREQMLAAQEMFRLSNKVTRPEKALILGFMAGSRENPCPQQGDVVTIKLSENVENTNGIPMMVDTFFEMNYSTGQWKRYKTQRTL